jgi:hypothetical protein
MAEQDMFSGLVYCADCGGTMVLHRAHTMDSVKNNFMCSTYKKQGKEVCSAHYIRESQLAAIVLDDLRRVTHFARQQEALFVQHIHQKNSAEAKHELERLQRELDAMKHRDAELSALFRRLYEDNVLGRITNEQFRVLSEGYNDEQSSLNEKIPQIVEQMEKLQASVTNVSRFVEKAKRYTVIPELTSELLHLFIERIEVGERGERYSRTAEQKIVIRYRDIGVLEAFMEEDKENSRLIGKGRQQSLLSAFMNTHGSVCVPIGTRLTRRSFYYYLIHLTKCEENQWVNISILILTIWRSPARRPATWSGR